LIPFAGASLEQRIDIDLASGGRLYWNDAMMSGREGAGERWLFRSLEHQLRVRRGQTLAYLERYRIEPRAGAVSMSWIAGESTYVGTVLRAGAGDTTSTAELAHAQLSGLEGVSGAADVVDGDLLLVRIASATGVAFHRARHAVAAALGEVQKR
jgi:urease accessory protein UreH